VDESFGILKASISPPGPLEGAAWGFFFSWWKDSSSGNTGLILGPASGKVGNVLDKFFFLALFLNWG
jgi:hypothetical protein